MKMTTIEATDIPDLWFQALYSILDEGRRFKIDVGSYAGQTRLEFDYFTGRIKFPGTRPLLPEIPKHLGIPDPVSKDYIEGGKGQGRSYVEYLMSPERSENEEYTYGERLSGQIIKNRNTVSEFHNMWRCLDQVKIVIDRYKTLGHRNNQLIMQVGKIEDIFLEDPPCLRHIDTRIVDNKLHFIIYFRSWDLWGGLPANLAGFQHLKESMAEEIGVDDGEMIVSSKGLHLYGYAEKLAKIRCMK